MKEREIDVTAGFAGSRSHVLLAACRESERAYEQHSEAEKSPNNPSGVRDLFTRELISTLRNAEIDKVTYRALFQRIPGIPK